MKHTPDNKTGHIFTEKELFMLWVFPFLFPVLSILVSFLMQKWNWGLMDDWTILDYGKGILDRSWAYLNTYRAFGEFKPISALHSGIFYFIFEHSPDKFYIVRTLEICLIMFLWGFLAFKITKKILSLILVPVITLSFHYFYDAFFYLSSQEIIGLLFIGLVFYFFLKNVEYFLNEKHESGGRVKFNWGCLLIGLVLLLCGYWTKEPFISSGIAFGLAYLYLSFRHRRTRYLWIFMTIGMFIIIATLFYGVFLLCGIKGGYSSNYTATLPKISANLVYWVKKDLANHVPWIILLIFLYLGNIRKSILNSTFKTRWAVTLGMSFYILYLMILLPWCTVSYYVSSLGLFFAFFTAILISGPLAKINVKQHLVIVACFLMINQVVCQYALTRETFYEYDKMNLVRWFKDSNFYNTSQASKIRIRCNAIEPSKSIPGIIKRVTGLDVDYFVFSRDPGGIVDGKSCDFYLYGSRFRSIDLSELKDWKIVFISKNWVMYRRPDN